MSQRTGNETTTRAHHPIGAICRFAQRRRRTNLHRNRGRLDASSRQARGSATSWPPRARQGTTATTWALRARLTVTPETTEIGAPMPAPRMWHLRRTGPAGARELQPDVIPD